MRGLKVTQINKYNMVSFVKQRNLPRELKGKQSVLKWYRSLNGSVWYAIKDSTGRTQFRNTERVGAQSQAAFNGGQRDEIDVVEGDEIDLNGRWKLLGVASDLKNWEELKGGLIEKSASYIHSVGLKLEDFNLLEEYSDGQKSKHNIPEAFDSWMEAFVKAQIKINENKTWSRASWVIETMVETIEKESRRGDGVMRSKRVISTPFNNPRNILPSDKFEDNLQTDLIEAFEKIREGTYENVVITNIYVEVYDFKTGDSDE
jgi:hypothetical protein